MPLTLFLYFVAVGAWGLAWARILPADGHLLAPAQRWAREAYRRRFHSEADDAWWWRPAWGCAGCHAAQVAAWSYPLRYHATYDPLLHLLGIGLSLTTACLLTLQWNQPPPTPPPPPTALSTPPLLVLKPTG